MEYFEALEARRSQYGITDTSKISDEEIVEVVQRAIKHTPSPYNIQPTRAVILFGENHKKLWEITKEVLLKKIGPERFKDTEEKINTQFLAGYGSILFYLEKNLVKKNAEELSENFYKWSDHSIGIAQGNVWTSLASVGLGASLQHYNPIIDEKVKEAFDIPDGWELVSQMPFGDVASPPKQKEFLDINELVRIKK